MANPESSNYVGEDAWLVIDNNVDHMLQPFIERYRLFRSREEAWGFAKALGFPIDPHNFISDNVGAMQSYRDGLVHVDVIHLLF